MASFNTLILVGHLTRDPELQQLPSGTSVCRLGLATNHTYTDRDGNKQEEVMFIDIDAFGKTADTCAQYLTKGRQILVRGRLRFRQWEDDQGNKRSKHDMFLENFTFLGGNGDNQASGQGGGQTPSNQQQSSAPVQDDDIPF